MGTLRALLVAVVISTSAFADANRGLYLVVTPASDGFFSCTFSPESTAVVATNDLIRFKVTVKGGSAPYRWRVPLYKEKKGANHVALARVGLVTPDDDHTFLIDLNVSDLERIGEKKDLVLQLRSRERFETTCRTAAQPIRSIAAAAPPKELTAIEGAISR